MLFPLNRSGDGGWAYENGVVRTPKGLQARLRHVPRRRLDGGDLRSGVWWPGLATVGFALQGDVHRLNQAFAMYPGLSHGAYEALSRHGSDALKKLYLPKLTDGTWTGMMCLTEPSLRHRPRHVAHQGRALQADGSYAITGTKIFIIGRRARSGGKHPPPGAGAPARCAGWHRQRHLVVPGAEVPPNDGWRGRAQRHPLRRHRAQDGHQANATCVMNSTAPGLAGRRGSTRGMPAMFVMMNAARLGVGMQGLGIAETSRTRAPSPTRAIASRAGRLTGPKNARRSGRSDHRPIPTRRMLMIQNRSPRRRARAVAVGRHADRQARSHPDADSSAAADDLVQMLTPIIKAHFTDMGSECANLAVQTTAATPASSARTASSSSCATPASPIYEGHQRHPGARPDRPQAADEGGGRRSACSGEMGVAAHKGDDKMKEFVEPLEKALGRVQDAALFVAARHEGPRRGRRSGDRPAAPDGAQWRWLCGTASSSRPTRDSPTVTTKAFYEAKLATARFIARVLPQTTSLNHQIKAGARRR